MEPSSTGRNWATKRGQFQVAILWGTNGIGDVAKKRGVETLFAMAFILYRIYHTIEVFNHPLFMIASSLLPHIEITPYLEPHDPGP